MPSVIPLLQRPGYKRDGTVIDGDYCTDGEWTRFNNFGRPRKMGGYRLISQDAHGPVYGLNVQTKNGSAYVFMGSSARLEMKIMSMIGVGGGIYTRTPAGFVGDDDNIWKFDSIYDLTSGQQVILAHPGANLTDIDANTTKNLYYGALTGTTALTATTAPAVSGGVCVLHPFAFVYGDDGFVAWCDEGQPNIWVGGASGNARITDSKVVHGCVTRGGGQAPAGLFWSLTSLVRASFVGGAVGFTFDTVTDQSSIMSSRGVIEMDGVWYWPGIDRFLMYNGVVQEIPNQLNFYWFFDNIDLAKRQLLWATKVPRHGEIWWFFARGASPVPDYAIIYNVRLQTWYDTVLPEGGRSDGFFGQVFPYPVWAGITPDDALGLYALWQHELYNSYDKTSGVRTDAVRANFTTPDLNLLAQAKINNIRLLRIEPDFVQTGDMSVQSMSRPFPKSDDVVGPEDPCTFTPTTPRVDAIRTQGRYVRLKFESNVAGGFYEVGETVAHVDVGDERPVGATT